MNTLYLFRHGSRKIHPPRDVGAQTHHCISALVLWLWYLFRAFMPLNTLAYLLVTSYMVKKPESLGKYDSDSSMWPDTHRT